MASTTSEIAEAREAVAELLEELGLEAYLFAVEPRNAEWELKVDCAMDGNWETVTIPVPKEWVMKSREDTLIRQRLLRDWQDRLGACKVRIP